MNDNCRKLSLVALAATILLAGPARAAAPETCPDRPAFAPDENPGRCLAAYLTAENVDPGTPVLAFDHSREQWLVGRWNGSQLEGDPLDVEFDVNCKPRVRLRGRDRRLLTVVYDTNPVLYSIESAEIEELEPESLAQLQRLAGLFGPLLQALSQDSRQADSAIAVSAAAFLEVPPAPPDADPAWRRIANELQSSVEERRKTLQRGIDKAQREVESIQHALTLAENLRVGVRRYLREIESGRTPHTSLASVVAASRQGAAAMDLDLRLDQLEASLLASAADLGRLPCRTAIRAAATAIELSLPGAARDAGKRDQALETLNDKPSMIAEGCDPTLREQLGELAAFVGAAEEIPESDQDAFEKLAHAIDSLLTLADGAEKLRQRILEAKTEIPKTALAVQSLARLAEREPLAPRLGTDTTACLLHGVIPIVDGDPRLAFLKPQARSFEIAVDAPQGDQVLAYRAAGEHEFEVAHRWYEDIQLNVGLVYTEIADPEFGTVSHPDEDDTLIVARTDEETRAGQPVLFLGYPLTPNTRDWRLRPVVEIGAGLDTDAPSAYLGFGFSLGRFARLGFGYGTHRVRELARGQSEAQFDADGALQSGFTVVESADDIRTRNDWDGDWYASLTITLNDLPFFDSLTGGDDGGDDAAGADGEGDSEGGDDDGGGDEADDDQAAGGDDDDADGDGA